jgi:hypothetical protein
VLTYNAQDRTYSLGTIRSEYEYHISISNENPFSQGMNGFQISPRMQELIAYAGQLDCYARCNEVIKQFLDVEVSHAHAHRVTAPMEKNLENPKLLKGQCRR